MLLQREMWMDAPVGEFKSAASGYFRARTILLLFRSKDNSEFAKKKLKESGLAKVSAAAHYSNGFTQSNKTRNFCRGEDFRRRKKKNKIFLIEAPLICIRMPSENADFAVFLCIVTS